jgi:hypothetical protein
MDMKSGDLLPQPKGVPLVTADNESDHIGVLATRDHEVVRRWAAHRQAKPATGEATRSGPATINVNDGGAGIRFNFPGVSPQFRAIRWEEWFDAFDQHQLVFVYENFPEQKWPPSTRFRFVKADDWPGQFH